MVYMRLILCFILLLAFSAPVLLASQDAPPAPPVPFQVTVTPLDRQVHSGSPFRVKLQVTNVSPVPQSFVAWSCGWQENWQIRASKPPEKSHVAFDELFGCDANAEETITLKPGESYQQQTIMVAWTDKKGHKFFVHFQVGFSPRPMLFFSKANPAEKIPVYWSDEAVMEVVK